MKKYILFYFIVLAGCKQITIDDEYIIDGSGEYIYLSTSGLINPKSQFITYYDDQQNCWLFYGNPDRRELIIYALPSGEIEKRIQFDSHGPNGIGGYRGVLVHNFDSIFLISSTFYSSLFLTDTTGKVKRKYTLDPVGTRGIPPALMPLSSHISQQNVLHKGHITLGTYMFYSVDNSDLHKEIISIDIDLNEGRIIDSSNYESTPKSRQSYKQLIVNKICST